MIIYFASIGAVLALLGIFVPQALVLLTASRTGVMTSAATAADASPATRIPAASNASGAPGRSGCGCLAWC